MLGSLYRVSRVLSPALLITCLFHQCLGLMFSRLTWPQGIQWTGEGLQHRFWWATVEEDTQEFVSACPVCNQHRPCHQAPAGLL